MASALLTNVEQFTQLASHNRLAMLTFRLSGAQVFGINVFKVREVLRRPPMEHMPSMHRLVCGSFDYRGQTIPVIDMALAMGYEPLAEVETAHIIVTEFSRSTQAFLVSDVDRIVHVEGANMSAPSSGLGYGTRVNAVTRLEGKLLAVVDVEQILAEVDNRPIEVSPKLQHQAEARPISPRRVLVVDDSVVARKQIEGLLKQMQFEVVLANDGADGLNKLHQMIDDDSDEGVALVISDIEMPRMDGYALTRAIREDAKLKGTKVLLHSSLSGVFNESMVANVGANRFVAKFQPDILAAAVLELLPPTS